MISSIRYSLVSEAKILGDGGANESSMISGSTRSCSVPQRKYGLLSRTTVSRDAAFPRLLSVFVQRFLVLLEFRYL